MNTKLFFLLFILFTTVSIEAQALLNLDFENYSSNGKAKGWYTGGDGYNVFVDTTVYYSGKSSLCIKQISKGSFGVASANFSVEDAKGKLLKYTGYIKTDSVTNGYAGLWWRVDGKSGILNFDNMYDRGAKGTTEWKKYSVELKIDENATNIVFGVLMPGNGRAWFDNLQIELDGKVYEQRLSNYQLSTDQLNWLKSNINPFETSDPKHDNSDLSFLKKMIGSARIVSLGEGTHGTSEFFKMKHRITKYLAEEMGFTVFAIEANMPEAKLVNDYLLNGNGDPKKALAGLYFWTWNTQEVLDMIEWMREFNKSKKGRIEFWGFDMQTPNVAVQIVEDFFSHYDSAYFNQAKGNYDKVISSFDELKQKHLLPDSVFTEPVLNCAAEVLNYILNKAKNYQGKADNDKIEWAVQNAKIVVQSIECMMKGKTSRDESMAYNIEWLLNHFGKDTKIVLWAHNGHVSKNSSLGRPMGSFLNQKYGNEMVVFGFGFYEGNYTAVGKNGLNIYSTSLPEPGSFEWILHNTGREHLVIDMRKIPNSPLSSLLKDDINFRSIGAMAMDEAFYPTKLLQDYDAVIYFDKTTPSACFGLTKK